jgi:predicted phosphoadenosine phosphosulfate sulfurtransferase
MEKPQRLRTELATNVFEEAIDRMVKVYEEGHRVVVSFSGGKDSGTCVEICVIAATLTGRLPVEVVMRDEEIMFPGTFEYAERMYHRPDIDFRWIYANQPVVNVFNRRTPFFWVFDPQLPPESWVRQPPPFAIKHPYYNIETLISKEVYPPAPGKDLVAVLGLRVQESPRRKMGLMSSGGYLTKRNHNFRFARPIYDWGFGDVWKAHKDNNWDYNSAYDVMHRHGVNRNSLRISPPTMSAAAINELQVAAAAFPKWADKVDIRCPGVRSAINYGKRAVMPIRRLGETWEGTFDRTCVKDAPAWISERAVKVRDAVVKRWNERATFPFPDKKQQGSLSPVPTQLASWEDLCKVLYTGDPFSLKQAMLPYVEPHYFRQGDNGWGGKPSW